MMVEPKRKQLLWDSERILLGKPLCKINLKLKTYLKRQHHGWCNALNTHHIKLDGHATRARCSCRILTITLAWNHEIYETLMCKAKKNISKPIRFKIHRRITVERISKNQDVCVINMPRKRPFGYSVRIQLLTSNISSSFMTSFIGLKVTSRLSASYSNAVYTSISTTWVSSRFIC